MHRKALTIVVCALLVAGARDASAQTLQDWLDRGYVNLNVGFESTSGTLDDRVDFQLYEEPGRKDVRSAIDSGAFIDFSIGGRVWRNVSAGIGFHREATTGQGTAGASVPSPIVFNRNREVNLNVDDLNRVERAIHLQAGYMLPFNERLSVHVFAGPSFFRLTQDVVGDLTFTEQPPAFTAVSAAATVIERKRSRTGANIGADVTYLFLTEGDYKLGAGLFVRYSGTTAAVQMLGDSGIESDLGGLQIGFGGRLRF
jgi:hypothetical protein